MITDNLEIKILEKKDLEFARKLHNDDSVLENLTDPTHVNEIQQENWFNSICESKTSMRYSVYEKYTNNFIGIFRIDMLDYKNKSVMVGMDIVKEQRGKGYSKETYLYFLNYFYNSLGFNRIYLYVLETNHVAYNLYLKLGFIVEGKQRSAIFRHGKYIDYIMMSMLRSEFKK